ncbi:type V CRISPR-associated protein Cas12k [Anabaenopsis elenkinii]|uniref:Type V CRISPR-associated protein Cas12k n=1 Tax=Anabaenopsis elenkinii CCIBt3563 TaxID=2779889 RepID=A0A7S6RF21_9CYAN|nr:type V CRISPR-associated protein Cas12k [Anabaenopsis elenkinii]QOV23600.1 type V CRISPR-associated protein Cas12k [Anabaenopsis elenkinii CCIBt3563]
MSQITVQCHLVASESTRRQLWKLMAELNTPLINELLQQLSKHPDFEKWRKNGNLPSSVVSKLCKPLETDPRFAGQPSRCYSSAIYVVDYIYKSWLTIQKRLQQQLDGKIRWLEMLNSDAELVETTGYSLEAIRAKAVEILTTATPTSEADASSNKRRNTKKSKKASASNPEKSVSHKLFDAYQQTDDTLSRSAISYLLKNGCKLNDKEEDPEKFAQRRRKLEIQIQRLTDKLTSRIPKGRDLTKAKWLETLFTATTNVPEDNTEAKCWQDILLSRSSSLPFPLIFETNEDLVWSKNEKGRLCVHFNGLTDLTFEVYCDSRQLHWFKRFLEDQQTKRKSKNQYSSALFTLRNGRIGWQEGEGKGEPWLNRLTLSCCVDNRLWTAEGTEQVRQQKAEEIAKILTNMKKKSDLTDNQQAFIQRKQTTLTRLNNSYDRPSQPLYQGQSHILVGVSLGLEKPATVAVVDASANKILAYRSIKQLLGENYELLNRQRKQQRYLSHQRHKAQKSFSSNEFGTSELGQYIDRLLAKEIVAIAQTYKAGSIVLPKLGDMREIIQSEIQSLAEAKCPGSMEIQKKYAKQYRINVHQWSYGRLIQSIQSKAAQVGIVIEEGKQPTRASPQDQAKELAFCAYHLRLTKHS